MISIYIVQGAVALGAHNIFYWIPPYRESESGYNVNLKAKAKANVIEPSRRYPIGFLGFQLWLASRPLSVCLLFRQLRRLCGREQQLYSYGYGYFNAEPYPGHLSKPFSNFVRLSRSRFSSVSSNFLLAASLFWLKLLLARLMDLATCNRLADWFARLATAGCTDPKRVSISILAQLSTYATQTDRQTDGRGQLGGRQR